MYFYPVEVANVLQESYQEISRTCGFLYLLSGIMCFCFLIWLGTSEFGKVRLGGEDDTIEFSATSWLGMMFCAGIGAGLMRWAAVEWGYYYLDPPHGLTAESLSATEWAMSYPLFHWGPIAWSYYCLPAVAIAYPLYVKKIPSFRYSVSLYGLLGEAGLKGTIAKTVDVLFVVGLLSGAGYSLAVSIPIISGTFSHLTGLQDGLTLQVVSGLVCVLLFSCSAYLGLKKGIKRLSDWNIYLSFGLLLFVLAVGPTIFILNSSLSSLGFMAQNLHCHEHMGGPIYRLRFRRELDRFLLGMVDCLCPFCRAVCGQNLSRSNHPTGDSGNVDFRIGGLHALFHDPWKLCIPSRNG